MDSSSNSRTNFRLSLEKAAGMSLTKTSLSYLKTLAVEYGLNASDEE